MKNKIYIFSPLLIFSFFVIYIIFSFHSWNEPLMGDEAFTIPAIKYILNKLPNIDLSDPASGFLYYMQFRHPPLSIYLSFISAKLFGMSPFSFRIINITAFFASICLIYLLCRNIFEKHSKAEWISLLACLIFSTTPFAIKGSLLLDPETRLVSVGILGFLLILSKTNRTGLKVLTLFQGIVFGMLLWAKFATPLILAGTLFLYHLVTKNFKHAFQVLKIIAIGLACFCATWNIYYYFSKVPISNVLFIPLNYPKDNLIILMKKPIDIIIPVCQSLWLIGLWCSPSFIALSAVSCIKVLKEKDHAVHMISLKQITLFAICFTVFFLFMGAVSHAFPKYLYSIASICSILTAYLIIDKISFNMVLFKKAVILSILLSICYLFLLEDPLYLINYKLKEAIIFADMSSIAYVCLGHIYQIALVVFSISAIYLYFIRYNKKEAFILALACTMFSFNIFMSLVQIKADYNTAYCYGAVKIREVSNFIHDNTKPKDLVIAPIEFISLSGNNNLNSYYLSSARMLNNGHLLSNLRTYNVICFAYGITGNSISQYKNIINSNSIQAFLRENYTMHSIWPYTIWIKNKI